MGSEMCIRDSSKNTLLLVNGKSGVIKPAEQLADVLNMDCNARAGNKDVIQVHEDKWQASKDAVHQPLEGLGRVFKAERHSDELVEPEGGDDRRLLHMFSVHWNLVITTD